MRRALVLMMNVTHRTPSILSLVFATAGFIFFSCSGQSPGESDGMISSLDGSPAPTGSGGLSAAGGSAIENLSGDEAAARDAAAIDAGDETGTSDAGDSARDDASAQIEGTPETEPVGYAKATSGGGCAMPLKADTLEAMQQVIDAYPGSGGLVVLYTGEFDFSSVTDACIQQGLPPRKLEIVNKNDITVLGEDGSSADFAIHIASSSSNIVVRNMTFCSLPGGSRSSVISLEGTSDGVPSNIWIDHNEIFGAVTDCPSGGDAGFGAMIDILKGSDNVVVSYNYFHDHDQACSNGLDDGDSAARHVTFHHNYFENIGSRTPLQRHGFSHIFNNYFNNVTTYGINVLMGGYALIEANYFENVHNPVTSREGRSIGYWELRDNNLAVAADVAPGNAFGITWDDGDEGDADGVNATDWTTTAAFPDELGYGYEADSFQCVREGLREVAGAYKNLATLACE
ncbi:MAG: polysaccharide lyase family 1 protein [Deltaproteobacteria bacterium]|nr:polysaccharide lyase family 1 protein [Deltaproteobacteria bacterium]